MIPPDLKLVQLARINLNAMSTNLRALADALDAHPQMNVTCVQVLVGYAHGEHELRSWGPQGTPLETMGWLQRALTRLAQIKVPVRVPMQQIAHAPKEDSEQTVQGAGPTGAES